MNEPLPSLERWILSNLSETHATDLLLNGPQVAFVDCGRGLEPIPPPPILATEFHSRVIEFLSRNGKSWDARAPFVDFQLQNQHRVHVGFPPATGNQILISVRAHPKSTSFWKNTPAFAFLCDLARRRQTLLFAGATGCGKTTLASEVLSELSPSERILLLEDTAELSPDHAHLVRLHTRPPNSDGFGTITLSDLIRQALRMRPDRILLGECRGPEVLDLLQCLNTGHRGTLSTIHANSPRDALLRIELLARLKPDPLPSSLIKQLITHGIQWIVHLKRDPLTNNRLINSISEIAGKEGDTILLRPVLEEERWIHNPNDHLQLPTTYS